jgi:hypothetical protein
MKRFLWLKPIQRWLVIMFAIAIALATLPSLFDPSNSLLIAEEETRKWIVTKS